MTALTAVLVLASVTLNAVAQIVLKQAVAASGVFAPAPLAMALLGKPLFWAGLFCFGGSLATWLLVLSRLPVSVAYPLASLGYVAAAVLGVLLLGESLGGARIAGIGVICLGVFLVAR